MKKETSENFSFKGWSIKEWLNLNKIEIIKLATSIVGVISAIIANWNPILVALLGLILKFGLDSLHYFLNSQEVIVK